MYMLPSNLSAFVVPKNLDSSRLATARERDIVSVIF